jgi:hypothetical protein
VAIEQKFNENENNNTTTGVSVGGTSVGQSRPAPQQRQGSGLFTDLNKYIQANQGAGQRTAQGISQNLTNKFEPEKTNVFNTGKATASGIDSGQKEIEKGSGYKTLFEQNKPELETVANDNTKAAEFAKFRTGQGVNINQLNNTAGQAETANIAAQQKLDQYGQQVASEQGRFGLLRDVYGGLGKRYGSGQQKLDQLLLQSGGNNNVAQLKGSVTGLQQSVNPEIQKLAQYKSDIGNLQTGQAGLASDLTNLSSNAFNQKDQELTNNMQNINAARRQGLEDLGNTFNSLVGAEGASDFSQNMAEKLKLNLGQRTFGALDNLNVKNDLTSKLDERMASDINQTSNQEQLNRYNALQKLMKSGYDAKQNVATYDNNLNKTLGEQLGRDNVVYKDFGDLASRGEDQFRQALMSGSDTIYGTGKTSQTQAKEGVRLSDYLVNPEDRSKFHYKNSTDWNKDNAFFNDEYTEKDPVAKDILGVKDGMSVLGIGDASPLVNASLRAIGIRPTRGISMDEYRDAENYAHADLIANINNSLDKSGYSQQLGSRGIQKSYTPEARYANIKKRFALGNN